MSVPELIKAGFENDSIVNQCLQEKTMETHKLRVRLETNKHHKREQDYH